MTFQPSPTVRQADHPKVIQLFPHLVKQREEFEARSLTLAQEIADFLTDRQAQNFTRSTLAWYQRCMDRWQEFLMAQQVAATLDVTPAILRRFLVHLQERGHTPGGVITLFTGVKAYLNWYAAEHNAQSWNPLAKVKSPRRPKELLHPVSLDHVRSLLDHCPPGTFTGDRDRAILLFLLDTGVRHQELTNLTVGQLDLMNGEAKVVWGKGRKDRTVFVGERTGQALVNYLAQRQALDPASPLWVQENGDPLAKTGIRQAIRRRAEQANVPEPGMHAFRRAFAVNALRNGMDVISLQRILGHADLETLHRYLDLVTDDLRRVHQETSVVDRL